MLYNEERPMGFNSLRGQYVNRQIFMSQINSGNYSHAYLFAGHHGSGKTTSARILARAAECEHPTEDGPCCRCMACQLFDNSVDVVEIDAASNTGVDAIRDRVIEAVKYRPVELKRKAIIIDEVHMLSTSAFNALLKTIEEPPKDVILFLCTTELHKVPATIVSRCQKFIFNAVPFEEIKTSVLEVSKKHGINIESKAAEIIAKAADGSMRDALSILEQAAAEDITVSGISRMVGIGDMEIVFKILDSMKEGNFKDAVNAVDEFMSYSNVPHLIDSLLEAIIDRACNGDDTFLELVDKLSGIRGSSASVIAVKAVIYAMAVEKKEDNSILERIVALEKEVEQLKSNRIVETLNVTEKSGDEKEMQELEHIGATQEIIENSLDFDNEISPSHINPEAESDKFPIETMPEMFDGMESLQNLTDSPALTKGAEENKEPEISNKQEQTKGDLFFSPWSW